MCEFCKGVLSNEDDAISFDLLEFEVEELDIKFEVMIDDKKHYELDAESESCMMLTLCPANLADNYRILDSLKINYCPVCGRDFNK